MNIAFVLSLSISCGLVIGCVVEPPQVIAVADEQKRAQALSVLEIIADANISRNNVTGVANCLLDNSSDPEIVSLAGASFTGITQKTVDIGLDIASRVNSITCIEGLGLTRIADG